MIHIMNFKGEIVDFISQSDSAVIQAVHKRDINERMETFDFTILSERTTYLQERNRIIVQDKNGQYREFIIDRISGDIDGYTEVETVASYLEDITKGRPYAPGKLEKMTTKQALSDVLKDTGWQVSDATEYGGLRTTSWTSYQTRYDVLLQLCTTYKMMADFYIEIGSNRVDKRYVVLRKRNPLFKGKEITYGKDLTGLKRTVDFSEIKTALLCVGPEPEEGKNRVELVVKDDEAQAKYGLPGRYNWGIYEPETDDQNMTEKRLRTLGTTELNKRKSEVITYEVTAIDIEKEFKHEVINLGDMVRIKNRDFTPPLYVEAEVISEEYNLISGDVTYNFGTYKEFKESDLRSAFDRKLDAIRAKLNDGLSNVNTIVQQTIDGELQYFERKILKGDTAPDNPVNDLLWLDTSNPKVAVLRRYWNGEWIKSSAENAEDVGAVTREQALYSDLSNTFVNLNVQHSRLMHDASEALESEYLVDTDIKAEVNSKLNDTIGVFNEIKQSLNSMTEETATIGKLVDTQALFLKYREKMQVLYNAIETAKIAIDNRFKLLQSQYTDEKFNEAMNSIASSLPDGVWNAETGELTSSIPNEERIVEIENGILEEMANRIAGAQQLITNQTNSKIQQVKDSVTLNTHLLDQSIENLNSSLQNYTDSEVKNAKDEISFKVQSVKEKIEGLKIGGNNLLRSYSDDLSGQVSPLIKSTQEFEAPSLWATTLYDPTYLKVALQPDTEYTISYDVELTNFNGITNLQGRSLGLLIYDSKERKTVQNTLLPSLSVDVSSNPLNTALHKEMTFTTPSNWNELEPKILGYFGYGETADGTRAYPTGKVYNLQLKRGNKISDWTPAPEDIKQEIESVAIRTTQAENNIQVLQDSLLLTATKSDVERILDENLETLKNVVSEQKAQLQIMANSIDSKVSQSDYTTDKNGIIERLNTADTERRQIHNEISDRVTLTEYQKGLDDLVIGNVNLIKSYKSSQNNVNGTIDNDYSARLPLNRRIDFNFYEENQLEPNTDYILQLHKADADVDIGVFYNQGRNTIASYSKNRIIRFNTGDKNNFKIVIIARADNQHVGKVSLYKGTKELAWTPNPEDVEKNISAAKDYADSLKAQQDKVLTEHNTKIEQNGRDINARATVKEFNASRKTLSRVLADLTINTTTGLSFTYDENGSIQSHTIGPDGIKLKGDRVDITVNKDFNVLVNDVANKADETNIINKINLSREGLDINVNNIGIRGGNSVSYVDIRNDLIELSGEYTRTFRGDTQKDNVLTRMKDGLLRFRNNTRNRSLYYSDFGISTYVDGGIDESSGTLQFFDYTYSENARGVTLNSVSGVVALRSDNNSIVIESSLTTNIESNNYSVYVRPFKQSRAGLNEFQFYIKDRDSVSETDGCLLYGNLTDPDGVHGSGIRFSKSRTDNILYVTNPNGDIGTGDISVRAAEIREHIRTIGMLEVRQWNDSTAFNQIKVGAVNTTNSVVIASHSGGNAYYGVGGYEMRVTNNNGYNGGDTSYRPVRASAFNNASLAEYKKDIKVWDYDALRVIANNLELYQYRYKNDTDDQLLHRGVVIGDGYQTPPEFIFEDGVNLYEMITWSLRAIQQLNQKIKVLEEKTNG